HIHPPRFLSKYTPHIERRICTELPPSIDDVLYIAGAGLPFQTVSNLERIPETRVSDRNRMSELDCPHQYNIGTPRPNAPKPGQMRFRPAVAVKTLQMFL